MKQNKIILFILLCLFSELCTAEVKLLVLGDSLTEGHGIDHEKAYPALLQKIIREQTNHKEAVVLNAGISGSTSASGPSRLKWHLKANPTHMILALGANDGLRGVKIQSTTQNLSQIIETAKAHGVKVILAGMKLPLNYGKRYRQDFEQMYQQLSQKYQVHLIPFLLKGVGGIKSLNLADGIHPNEKGHQIMAQTVFKSIKDLL